MVSKVSIGFESRRAPFSRCESHSSRRRNSREVPRKDRQKKDEAMENNAQILKIRKNRINNNGICQQLAQALERFLCRLKGRHLEENDRSPNEEICVRSWCKKIEMNEKLRAQITENRTFPRIDRPKNRFDKNNRENQTKNNWSNKL